MLVVSSFRPTLLLYHNVFLLSRGFLKVFKKLFRFAFRSPHRSESPSPMRSPKALLNPQTLGIFYCDFCRFFGSSSIIPHPSPFVNTFFESFLIFSELFRPNSLEFAVFCGGITFYHFPFYLSIPFSKKYSFFNTFLQRNSSHKIAKPYCKTSRNAV